MVFVLFLQLVVAVAVLLLVAVVLPVAVQQIVVVAVVVAAAAVDVVVEVVVESRRTRRRGVDFVHVSNHVSCNVSQRALAMYVNYPHRGIMWFVRTVFLVNETFVGPSWQI